MRAPAIFVFGSNLAGRHGAGAALFAHRYCGAVYGMSHGLQGGSYAIPTKNKMLQPLPLGEIQGYVGRFLEFARAMPDRRFRVTPIGCGLAGYRPDQIAPFFADAPSNVELPPVFLSVLFPLRDVDAGVYTISEPCLHDWVDIAQIYRAEIDERNPIAHTTFVLLGCTRCRTVDAFPASNAQLATARYIDTLRASLLGWQLPLRITWSGPRR